MLLTRVDSLIMIVVVVVLLPLVVFCCLPLLFISSSLAYADHFRVAGTNGIFN